MSPARTYARVPSGPYISICWYGLIGRIYICKERVLVGSYPRLSLDPFALVLSLLPRSSGKKAGEQDRIYDRLDGSESVGLHIGLL
jgi:hypothetical protein